MVEQHSTRAKFPTVTRSGSDFGRLTVLGLAGTDAKGGSFWNCSCVCGTLLIVSREALVTGFKKSCGCLYVETRGKQTGARTHGMFGTPTYYSWVGMRERCTYPKHRTWKDYGGRGITVCERWLNRETGFINFLADMGLRPAGKTLDRWPNPDGNYEPGNCRWATGSEQRYKSWIDGGATCQRVGSMICCMSFKILSLTIDRLR
jgi:hypothetical protein